MTRVFFEQLNISGIILILAAFISLGCAIGYPNDESITQYVIFIILMVDVIAIMCLQFYQKRKSIVAVKRFKSEVPKQCQVLRNGQIIQIAITDLIIGDIVELVEGCTVPADLRMIQSRNLTIDKSMYTGDSEPQMITVEVDGTESFVESSHTALFGSICRSGSGRGVVILIGADTAIGEISDLAIQKQKSSSNLRQFLLTFQIILIGFVLVLSLSFIIYAWLSPNVVAFDTYMGVVNLTVAIIPEGLFVSISISLAMATRRLAKKHILVLNSSTIEQLSEIDCICIPFQGQFTFSKYNVCRVRYNEKDYTLNDFVGKPNIHNNMNFDELYKCCIITSDHKYIEGEGRMIQNRSRTQSQLNQIIQELSQSPEKTQQMYLTDSTEKALMKFFTSYESPINLIEDTEYATTDTGIQVRMPFSSQKKYSLSVVKDNKLKCYTLYIKGAPEIIWSMCNKQLQKDQACSNTPKDDHEFKSYIKQQCLDGKRLIGFAYRKFPFSMFSEDHSFSVSLEGYDIPMRELTFLGVVALDCKIRPNINHTLQQMKVSGVKIIIFTGESLETVKSLSQECKFGKDCTFVEGQDLYLNVGDDENGVTNFSYVESKLLENCRGPNPVFFVRMDPLQKIQILKACQTLGFKVAVTGDLMSFRYAALSIASQTLSAQPCVDACDVTLTSQEDTFLPVFTAIVESRRALENLAKTFIFTMSSNTAKIIAILCYYFLRTSIPLNIPLMLAVSVLTDIVVAIGFSREESELELLEALHHHQNKLLVSDENLENFYEKSLKKKDISALKYRTIFQGILTLGLVEAAAVLFAYFSTMSQYGFLTTSLIGTNFEMTFNYTKVEDPTDDFLDSPILNNAYLDFSTQFDGDVCSTSLSSPTQYNFTPSGFAENTLPVILFKWEDTNMQSVDHRQIFVHCTNQCEGVSQSPCWRPLFKYEKNCHYKHTELNDACYTGIASVYASTAAFVALVICQLQKIQHLKISFNYFALRMRYVSYRFAKINPLAIQQKQIFILKLYRGLIFSMACIVVIIAVPGIKLVFQTKDIPFMQAFVALPFAMLILLIEELRKLYVKNL